MIRNRFSLYSQDFLLIISRKDLGQKMPAAYFNVFLLHFCLDFSEIQYYGHWTINGQKKNTVGAFYSSKSKPEEAIKRHSLSRRQARDLISEVGKLKGCFVCLYDVA